MTDIQALKKAAEAATRGKRHYSRRPFDDGVSRTVVTERGYCIASQPRLANDDWQADADLIALLDPTTVLELCRLAEIGERQQWAEFDPNTERFPRKDSTGIESAVCVVYRNSFVTGQMIRALAYYDFMTHEWFDLDSHEPIHVTHFYELLEPPK